MEILLYGGIYDYKAEEFINAINESEGDDLVVRMNCQGGDVFSGYGMLAKMQEHTGVIKIKVDGWAASMAAFMLLFSDDVEALDVSEFLFHRANMYISDESQQAFLDGVNAKMRKKMEEKIDSEKWLKVTGKSIAELFDPSKRIDVTLSAKQAKQVGLINRIVTLEPKAAKKIKADYERICAEAELKSHPLNYRVAAMAAEVDATETKILKTMTIEQLKADHSDVYAAAVKVGVEQERDRVGAFMAFVDVDAKAVSEGIKQGKQLSQTEMAELSRKSLQASILGNAQKETEKDVTTETPETAEEKEAKEVEAFNQKVVEGAKKRLNITA
jgi:ATP-dependent protease ClpP protease subunit